MSAAELNVDSYHVVMIEIELANPRMVLGSVELVPFDLLRNLVGSEQENQISFHLPAH